MVACQFTGLQNVSAGAFRIGRKYECRTKIQHELEDICVLPSRISQSPHFASNPGEGVTTPRNKHSDETSVRFEAGTMKKFSAVLY